MIILKHLTVERFRLLREVNLHFPQRGSVLIQGPNESGKSALLESIYFALYGGALTTDRGKRSLDDLILYGETTATVILTFSIGATEMTVARTLERAKEQQVNLTIRRLGMTEKESITSVPAANERIIAELSGMDGEALRASCLLEQKGLERLETLPGSTREAIISKLLGIDKLLRLTSHFKVTTQDELQLHEGREHLRLAEIQARIPELSQRLDDVETALDVVIVSEDLQEIALQQADIREQEHVIEQIRSQYTVLRGRLARIQQLRKADATLAEIIAAYDEMAEARRQLPELEKQIADLERREREDLPIMERRVNELGELTRSFGTLQRMSNDLLTAVDTIKELEQELKKHDEVQDNLKGLDEQIVHAKMRLQQAHQALQDLEERRRAGRPQLEARLQRLTLLSERLLVLRQVEDRYTRRMGTTEQIEKNEILLQKVLHDLRDTEQELHLVEAEAKQVQGQVDALEKRWRYLSLRRQLEEWLRLKGLSQGLVDAEQHVRLAHQQQEKLMASLQTARSSTGKFLIILSGSVVVLLVSVVIALFVVRNNPLFLSALIVLALASAAGAGWGFQHYTKAREEENAADKQVQDAISRVSMMVAAREAAARMVGGNDPLAQIEQEIRTLGGTVPRSLDEAQQLLQQLSAEDVSLAEIQQRLKEKSDEANASRNQVNVTMEAVAFLRKERARLEEQRTQGNWNDIDYQLQEDLAAVERMHQEITLLAGQEGLPLPSINARLLQASSYGSFTPLSMQPEEDAIGVPELEALVESTIKSTEREIASLDGKLDLVADLTAQARIHQEAVDVLLARRQVIEDRNARYQTNSPAIQIQRAREQQTGLRQALQGLQDSLRQRVKPLGVAFGQTAINNAEVAARKQLEELHITLGNKIMLQERHADYTIQLKERQESLAEHYKQLAKYSNMLGSWIVPLNPFAEALIALRTRCQQEIQDANESQVLYELDEQRLHEKTAHTTIEACQQEISEAQDRIATMLIQRNRPKPKSFSSADIIAVWPLLSQYSVQDRAGLEEDRVAIEKELNSLEEQELVLSTQLQTGGETFDLEQARARLEQLDRAYQTKKRGNSLVLAVRERLLRKMLPRTEHYMQQILPLLTSGRYHDVHLLTEPEEATISGGPFQLKVWDPAASDYVSRSALSGGAADQLSLALRLAFTMAILPRDLNAAPGFILLDEPLSSFDRGRTQALVDVVTGEILSQHFEQIFLISHSSAFDPTMFPYHVYMDNGGVVESNLPMVPNFSPIDVSDVFASVAVTTTAASPITTTTPSHVTAE